MVLAACDKFEAKVLAAQPEIEKKAMALYLNVNDKQAARRYLTDYSTAVALGAVNEARGLVKQFK